MSTLSSCRRAIGVFVLGVLFTVGCGEQGTAPPLSQEESASLLSALATPDIIVTTTSDAKDFAGGEQVSDLPGPDGKVSLREAITAANNTTGPQLIRFKMPTSDGGFNGTVFTIQPVSGLPELTDDATTIDGSTQTAFSGNTNAPGPEIVLNGSMAPDAFHGLGINPGSDGNVIHSLVVNAFANPGSPGIRISGSGNRITGCFIGTDETGAQARGNGYSGILIQVEGGPADNNRIIGNLVSGNAAGGIAASGHNNLVQENRVGTDVTGMVALGNGLDADGIDLSSSDPGPGTRVIRNLISGNTRSGIILFGADNSVIQGNRIGTNIREEVVPGLGNVEYGVSVGSGPPSPTSNHNQIGGREANQGNIIAGNGEGVLIQAGVQNSILRNRIFSNAGLGIDLGQDGVTPNDPGDADTGPNNLMNFPVLTNARTSPEGLAVRGTIDTPDPRRVTIELFANPVPTPGGDPSGHGEGAVFLGRASPNGQGNFTATLPRVRPGTLISATATDAAGNTSEFSANITAQRAAGGGDD